MAPEVASGFGASGRTDWAAPIETTMRAERIERMAMLLLLEVLAVVFVFLADEFVDFREVGTQREGAGHLPGLGEDVGVFEGGLVLQGVVIGARKALDDMERLGVLEAADLGLVVEADGIDDESVAFPMADGIAHPGWVRVDGVRAAAGGNDAERAGVLMQDGDGKRALDDLKLVGDAEGLGTS